MDNDLSSFEVRVLKMIAGEIEWEPWGAWIGACIEFLQDSGYVSGGIGNLHLTQKGQEWLVTFG